MFAAQLVAAAAAAAPGEAADKEARLAKLRETIAELRAALSSDRDRQHELRQQLRAAELDVDRLSRSLKDLDGRLRAQAQDLARLQRRRDESRAALAVQKRALERQIVASYAMGRQGYLKIVLNQQNPAVIGRTLTYYDYFHRARTERISGINHKLDEIEALERAIAREAERLEQTRREQRAQIGTLEETRRARRLILGKIEADIRTKEERLEQLLADERRLAELVERLREALAGIPPDIGDLEPLARFKGKLPWPVSGEIAIRFGMPRKAGALKWRGVTISTARGAEVRSIYHGRVAFADWLRGFGLLIIVDHGGGFMSLYGHNQSLYKGAGEWVEQGEVIAAAGDSGGRPAPALYFEIRHNGAPKDPVQWCRKAGPAGHTAAR